MKKYKTKIFRYSRLSCVNNIHLLRKARTILPAMAAAIASLPMVSLPNKDNWVLTHSMEEVLPFQARRVFQNAAHKVISTVRLRKIKMLKKDVLKASVLAWKMQSSLESVARSADLRITSLQAANAKSERSLTFHQRKHLGFTTTMRQVYVSLQERNEQLKSEYQDFVKRKHDQKNDLRDQIENAEVEIEHQRAITKSLQAELQTARDGWSANQLQWRAASRDLVVCQGVVQSLKQQLHQEQSSRAEEQAAKTLSEQTLNAQIMTQKQALLESKERMESIQLQLTQQQALNAQLVADKAKDLHEWKDLLQANQLKLSQEQAARSASDTQNYRELLAARGTLHGVETSMQKLRDKFSEVDSLRVAAIQNYQTAQHKLEQEKAYRITNEQKLRMELATALEVSDKKYKAVCDELNTYTRYYQTAQQQLVVAQAARARYQTLKNWIITHYDAHYKKAGQGDRSALQVAIVLHCVVNGLASGTSVQTGKLGDKGNFTFMFDSQFAS